MEPPAPTHKSFGDRLLSIPRWVLFLVLFVAASVPLFITAVVPNNPRDETIDLYVSLMKLQKGDTVLLQSDWTNSTRGESRGEFDAIVKLLMRKEVKFALMSAADPQAPQVARDAIFDLNEDRKKDNLPLYKRWDDFVDLGYFPSAEGTGAAMAADIKTAFKGKRDAGADGIQRDVFASPVLQNIHTVSDFKMMIIVTASNSLKIAVQRLNDKVMMASAVTGVMGPESLNYFNSGQLHGLAIGLKGVYDLETLMDGGINVPGPLENIVPRIQGQVPGWPGQRNLAKGTQYMLTLHSTVGLLILAVVLGNIGVALTRRRRDQS